MAIKQVTGTDVHGWLDVQIDGISNVTSLPYGLRVDTLGVAGGREKFRVLEGIRVGKTGSVELAPKGKSQFGSVPLKPAATVVLSLSASKVVFGHTALTLTPTFGVPPRFTASGGQSFFNQFESVTVTNDYGSNPVPIGLWPLQIPDEKHTLAERYLGRSRHATTWFRIGDGRDRYLHVGKFSNGCAAVTEMEKWSALWQYLILARKGDSMNVGTIRVVP